jgi:hypothetical protein
VVGLGERPRRIAEGVLRALGRIKSGPDSGGSDEAQRAKPAYRQDS